MDMVGLAYRARKRADRRPREEDGREPAAGRDSRPRPGIQGHPGRRAAGRPLLPQSVDVGLEVFPRDGHPRREVRRPREEIRQGSARRRNHRPRRFVQGDRPRRHRHGPPPREPLRLRLEALRRHNHKARPCRRRDAAHRRGHPLGLFPRRGAAFSSATG